MKNFYGDETRWFVGLVVNHTPPEGYEGRVKVRIRGVHSQSLIDIPESDLPWSQVVLPTTEQGVSGLGSTPTIMTGALVFGFFADGQSSQIPIVVGSLPKDELQTDNQKKTRKQLDEYPYVNSWEELLLQLKNIKRSISSVTVRTTMTYSNEDKGAADFENLKYHYLILRDGTLQKGLHIDTTGYDADSITLVFVGGYNCPTGTLNQDNYISERSLTRSQYNTYDKFINAFNTAYPSYTIIDEKGL